MNLGMLRDTSQTSLRLLLRGQLCFPIKCPLVLTSKIEYWKGYSIGLSVVTFLKSFVPFKI